MKTLSMFFLILISTNAFSQVTRPKTPAVPSVNITDACTLNFPKLKPIFVQDSSLYTTMNKPQRDLRLRTLKQGVVLKNKTEIRTIKSGCTHYIFLINIRPTEIKSLDSEYLYELAVTNLKLIPTERDEKFNLTLLLNALDKRNRGAIRFESDYYYLPCSRAQCTFRVIRSNGAPRDIEIIYDKIL